MNRSLHYTCDSSSSVYHCRLHRLPPLQRRRDRRGGCIWPQKNSLQFYTIALCDSPAQAPSPPVKHETPPFPTNLDLLPTPTHVPLTMQPPSSRYVARADMRLNPRTRLLSMQLEMPGVRREDLSVVLSTCLWNGVRQIVVRGRVYERWATDAETWDAEDGSGETKGVSAPTDVPEDGFAIIRERKYGEFGRAVAVPPETTVRNFLRFCIAYCVVSSIRFVLVPFFSVLGRRRESAARGRPVARACQM
jgi:hypothetical protein